ncbi:MAG: hypothetical protein IT363_04035 [Methanoregulaceae archaeon]|nr:hypothetical protein [Methanoregulaceae archaeon]
MKLLLMIVALSIAAAFAGSVADKKVYFMYFMRGEGTRPTDQKLLDAMQKGHIENMVNQANLGKLLAAGPLNDPGQARRGITVLHVDDEKQIPALFENDPYVKHDIMRVKAAKWDVDPKMFKPAVDPSSIVEYRLVLMKRGLGMQPENDDMVREHRKFMDGLKKTHQLAVWGTVTGLDGVREVMIFNGTDTDGIMNKLKEDAYVQKALMSPEILPLWMSKGVVGATK